jgi:hypothetical protein
MEKIENKKIIIGVGVVAVLIVAYYMMKKKKAVVIAETTTTSVNPTEMTRAEMVEELFVTNKLESKNESRAIYDKFNDAELKMIYDVDVKRIPVTPEYITMLKKYGWA